MSTPLISIIICTYNRSIDLERLLKDLLNQQLSGNFDYEIIVVDNNSSDMTQSIVENLMGKANGRLKYLKQIIKGKSNALNMGIGHAKGEIIAFTDDDVVVDENWLSSLAKCFDQYDCDGIGGRVLPIYPDQTPSWVRQNPRQAAGVVVIYDQGETPRQADETIERFIGANWAFKSSIFKECGMFCTYLGPGTPIMGEDEEFYFRLFHMNKKLYYCPQVIIRHPVDLKRLSWAKTASWHISLGRYQAYKQIQQGGDSLVYYGGAPRYLIKDTIVNFSKLLIHCGNHLAFWNAYRNLFRSIGMIQQYRISKHRKTNA